MADFAKLGFLAGRSQASVRREQQEFQRTTQLLDQQAAADRQRIALQSQREGQEFSAFMASQAQQRSQAWELEKVEMSARNRFDLQEASFAAKFQVDEMEQLKKTQETQLKIAAINKSREQIGDKTADSLILALETGISQVASAALHKTDPAKEALARIMGGGEVGAALSGDPSKVATRLPEQESLEVFTTASKLLKMRENLDPETQGELDQILRERNLQKMRRAIETLGGEKAPAQPIAVSADASFLKARIDSGQHSTATNKVMQEAISRGNTKEIKAVVAAVQSIEEEETRATEREAKIAYNREVTKQRQLESGVRERLGTRSALEGMTEGPSMSLAVPRTAWRGFSKGDFSKGGWEKFKKALGSFNISR